MVCKSHELVFFQWKNSCDKKLESVYTMRWYTRILSGKKMSFMILQEKIGGISIGSILFIYKVPKMTCGTKTILSKIISVQFSFSLVAQLCLTHCDPMDCSMPGLPVNHQLPECTQTHWPSDAIQPSHPLLPPSPAPLNLSQHQGLFQWASSLNQVAKVLEFQLQHPSFQWMFRTDLF